MPVKILIVSDTCGESTDAVGPALRPLLSPLGAVDIDYVPDSTALIQHKISAWCTSTNEAQLVLTSGGTGFTKRDQTPEAPGLVHAMLQESLKIDLRAAVGRPVAGTINSSLLVTLPGSPKGATENLRAILPVIKHVLAQLTLDSARKLHRDKEQKGKIPPRKVLQPDDSSFHVRPADRPRQSPWEMVSLDQALALIAKNVQPLGTKRTNLASLSPGSILAEDLVSPIDVPGCNVSIVDGYVVFEAPEPGFYAVGGVLGVQGSRDASRAAASSRHARTSIASHNLKAKSIKDLKGTPDSLSGPRNLAAQDSRKTRINPKSENPIQSSSAITDSKQSSSASTDQEQSSSAVTDQEQSSSASTDQEHSSSAKDTEPEHPSSASTGPKQSSSASTAPNMKTCTVLRVTTGAPVPPETWAVVPVEDTELDEATVDGEEIKIRIKAKIDRGSNIRLCGSDIRKKDVVLKRNTVITCNGGDIGVIASVGRSRVSVFKRPTVGVLSTGDELVDASLDHWKAVNKVYDANRPGILALLKKWGYHVEDLGAVRDHAGLLKDALAKAVDRGISFVVTTGGASMGEADLLKPAIKRLGGVIHFGRVAVKPGKPTSFATLTSDQGQRTAIFSLPGNPASALVCLHLLVRPALLMAEGRDLKQACAPRLKAVVRGSPLECDPRPEFHRVLVSQQLVDGTYQLVAESTGNQRSSRVGSLCAANGLACLPSGTDRIAEGSLVDCIMIGEIVPL